MSPRPVRAQPESFRGRTLSASLTASDLEKSLAWYRDVMGFTVDRRHEREGKLYAVSLKAGDVRLLLGQDDGAKGWDRTKGAGFSLRITTVQDIDGLAKRVTERGGTLDMEPTDTRWGTRLFRLKDPDGFTLVISSEPGGDVRLDEPEILVLQPQTTAVIHLTVPRSEIRSVMGPAISEVMGTLAAQGVEPAGPVFSHHFSVSPEVFDFEVGVPVVGPLRETGRVKAGQRPALRVARTVYHGPYERLGDAWEKFDEWIVAQGHKRGADVWESYLTGPESGGDPSTWRTELSRPLLG